VPTTSANGIELYYERQGSGPKLLFFNGSGATLKTSGALLLKPFAERFDVVAHDQRGLGETSVPEGPYTMADYAADGAALLDAVGWDTCRVFGVSFGGMVAQEFAVTYPSRVSRLALACTSPGGAGGSSYPLHELASMPAAERAPLAMSLMDSRWGPSWFESHPVDKAIASAYAERGAGSASAPERQRLGERLQLEARSHHDVWDRLANITCPTLVAGGRFDGIAPPDNSAAIASRIGGAELRMYDGGHLFMVQDPTAMPDIVEFLAA
jgi:pimeloyl-ACP methyl ester carboxylesterase